MEIAGNMDSRGGNNATSPAAAFVLGSPPLAALHSMTEMKTAMLQHYNTPTSVAAQQNLKNSHGHQQQHVRSSKFPLNFHIFLMI
jgi:hypothetical protein